MLSKLALLKLAADTPKRFDLFEEWLVNPFEDEKINTAIKRFAKGAEGEREKFIRNYQKSKRKGLPQGPKPPRPPKPAASAAQTGTKSVESVKSVKPMSMGAKATMLALALAGGYGAYQMYKDPTKNQNTKEKYIYGSRDQLN